MNFFYLYFAFLTSSLSTCLSKSRFLILTYIYPETTSNIYNAYIYDDKLINHQGSPMESKFTKTGHTYKPTFLQLSYAFMLKLAECFFWLGEEKVNLESWYQLHNSDWHLAKFSQYITDDFSMAYLSPYSIKLMLDYSNRWCWKQNISDTQASMPDYHNRCYSK